MSKNDGGAAFPSPGVAVSDGRGDLLQQGAYEGMSLRDYFAAKAMAACISNAPNCSQDIGRIGAHQWLKKQADYAYYAADAMLEARSK